MTLERITDKLVEMTPFVLSILRVVVGFLFFCMEHHIYSDGHRLHTCNLLEPYSGGLE